MPPREQLPVRSHDILEGEGARATHVSVFCPSRARSVPRETCAACPRAEDVPPATAGRGARVTCAPTEARRDELASRRTGPDVGEAAARIRLGEAMGTALASVRAGASLGDVERVMGATNQPAVVVLDGADGIAGIVTRRDLARGAAASPVTSVMRRSVHALPEDASLAHAIAVMACAGVRQVPVVGADAALVGMVSDRDVVRWLAARLGYEAPAVPWEDDGAAPTEP